MEARLREQTQIAGMVIMHMGDDHVFDSGGINVQQCQTFSRRAQKAAAPAFAFLSAIAHIDDDSTLVVADDPDEIIHGDRRIMGVAVHEHGTTHAHAVTVFDSVDFVGGFDHGYSSPS